MSKSTAFAGLGSIMKSASLQQLMNSAVDGEQATFSQLSLSEIKLFPQQREVLEVEGEQTLEDLAQDIRDQGVLQPIVVCQMPEVEGKRWRLVAGERRYRAAAMAGKTTIPAMVYGELTEDQINKIQYSENVQRLNLSMLNEAKVLAADMEELGSLAAVAKKRNKSEGWVSKRLALLKLGDEAQRIITDNVSNDVEVILAVSQVEKVDAQKAAELVNQLKELEPGKGNARQIAREVKDKVKPSKSKTAKKSKKGAVDDVETTTPERSDEAPSSQKLGKGGTAAEQLRAAYWAIRLEGADPENVVEALGSSRKAIEDHLTPFYERGVETEKGIAAVVFQGFADSSFATAEEGAIQLAAFLLGLEPGESFSLPKIFASLGR